MGTSARPRTVSVAILSLFGAATALGGPPTFFDGTFANGDWTLTMVHSTGTVNLPPMAMQMAAGGNPGAWRHVLHNQFTDEIMTFHARTSAVYTPVDQGPIVTIDFWIDARAVDNLFGIGIAIAPALRQNGNVYSAWGGINSDPSIWATIGGNYSAADFNNLVNQGDHPDFSPNGGPITFGFLCTNNNVGFFASRSVALDNWSVTINVPPPQACNAADIATSGNPDPQAGPDGFLTGDDFDLFVNAFFSELRRTGDNSLIADLVDGDGNPPPDGFLTGSDFDFFLARFFEGC